jgi:hypothetical protein
MTTDILQAMNIIAKLSFWIMKPRKKSLITRLSWSFKKIQPFEDLILDAFSLFRKEGYVEKLKTRITPESLPSNKYDLLKFLHTQIAHT